VLHEEREKERERKKQSDAMKWAFRWSPREAGRAGHNTPSWFGRSSDEELFGVASFFLSFFSFFFFFGTKILFLMFVCSLRHNQSHHLVIQHCLPLLFNLLIIVN